MPSQSAIFIGEKKMSTLKIYKETALPTTLVANAIYLVAPTAKPNYVEMYVTSNDGASVKRVIDETTIQSMIDATVSSMSTLSIVSNIAARNALNLTVNKLILVTDATGDSTVSTGAALYAYNVSTSTFVKVAEYESMDVTLTWASIQNKPSSTVAAIDDAVTKAHSHSNMTQLNKVGEDTDGNFTYSGSNPDARLRSSNW